jgi:hypothetical protein
MHKKSELTTNRRASLKIHFLKSIITIQSFFSLSLSYIFRKCLEQTLAKAKMMQPQPLQIQFGTSGIKDKGGPRDLLEAAKQMCAALSSLNITLDS